MKEIERCFTDIHDNDYVGQIEDENIRRVIKEMKERTIVDWSRLSLSTGNCFIFHGHHNHGPEVYIDE